ncbi:MAG: hypothetical protein AAGI69_05340 [Cyanobacteria bacterium P01_H01_bin.21]
MANSFFQAFKTWLHQRRYSLTAWLSTDQQEASEPENSLLQLPTPLRQRLFQQLRQLPSHPEHVEQLKTEFHSAFKGWYTENKEDSHPDDWDIGYHGNVWIIVSPSVANLQDVIGVFLKEIAEPESESGGDIVYKGLKVRLTQWAARPDVKSLQKVLQQQFGHKISSEHKREIVVIPCLEHCFLRSVDGLESIDYLRKHLLSDPSRFWILGLGQVGWKYLQAICTLDAYSDRVTHLSELSDQQLSEWIDPIISKLDINFPSSSLQSKLSGEELNRKEKYFKDLAKESEGIDTVAIQLFLNTLQVLDEDKADPQGDQAAPQGSKISNNFQSYQIQAKSPKHPSLPKLNGENIYLLYSLLLHRTLTKEELAESLGLISAQIEHPVQILRKAGVIEQQAKTLRLNPIYYSTVCTKLAGDNFSV